MLNPIDVNNTSALIDNELEKLSKDVQADTADFVAVTADTIDEKKAPKKEKKDTSKSIFKGI